MKKINALFLTLALSVMLCAETTGQSAAAVQKHIELANKQFVKWFNSDQADSIVSQYHVNACITGHGCGKEFLQEYYKSETGKYTFRALTTLGVTVKGNTAMETGQWKILLSNNTELSGRYETKWQRVNNRWLILTETVLE